VRTFAVHWSQGSALLQRNFLFLHDAQLLGLRLRVFFFLASAKEKRGRRRRDQ
jgi:hypothetical protein